MDEPGWRADPDIQPPFEAIEPPRLAAPLVFDSPHSGSRYPRAFLAASRLDPLTLRRSEDAFVDELFLPCVALGAPVEIIRDGVRSHTAKILLQFLMTLGR